MSILASIDIGSNTILLLVAKTLKNKTIIPLREEVRTPRLASGLKQSGKISAESLSKAIKDLNYFRAVAQSYGTEKIFAVATQAIRTASNRKRVIGKIESQTGLKIEVVSGEKEAELTSWGAVTGIPNLKPRRVVFDIGGASTEFVLIENNRIARTISLPLGAVAITEKYGTDKNFPASRLSGIEAELDGILENGLKGFHPRKFDLIGSGGTISTFKHLDKKRSGCDLQKAHGGTLRLDRLCELVNLLAALKLSERKQVIIFDPDRAEVIVAGGLILKSIIRYFLKHSVKVSVRSLRWGFLLSKL